MGFEDEAFIGAMLLLIITLAYRYLTTLTFMSSVSV